jgi:subfamily B ATP-binding cassette protein MsbA
LFQKKGPIRRLLGYVAPYTHLLFLGLLSTALASILNLAIYWIVKELVDKVLTGGDVVAMGNMLNITVIGVIVLFIVKGIFSYGQVYFMAYVGHRVVADLREQLYGHLQCMPIEYHDSKHTGEMISGVTNDVAVLQTTVSSGLAELVSQAVMSAGILGLMFYLDWKLSLVTLSIMPFVIWVVGKAGSRLRRITGLIQSTIADVTTVLQETLSGIKVIKAFTMEAHEMERFRRRNEGNFQASMRGAKVHALITPVIELLSVLGLAGVLWFGARRVIGGRLTVGEFMAFLGAAGTLPTPLARLSVSYGGFNQALGAALRVFNLLDEAPEVDEPEDAIPLPEPVEEGHHVSNLLPSAARQKAYHRSILRYSKRTLDPFRLSFPGNTVYHEIADDFNLLLRHSLLLEFSGHSGIFSQYSDELSLKLDCAITVSYSRKSKPPGYQQGMQMIPAKM